MRQRNNRRDHESFTLDHASTPVSGLQDVPGVYIHLFRQSSDSMFVVEFQEEQSPIILEVNDAACRALGLPREEIIGKPVARFDEDGHNPDIVRQRVELAREGKGFELRRRHPDGSMRIFQCSAWEGVFEGRHLGMSLEREVTEQRVMQQALQESGRRAPADEPGPERSHGAGRIGQPRQE